MGSTLDFFPCFQVIIFTATSFPCHLPRKTWPKDPCPTLLKVSRPSIHEPPWGDWAIEVFPFGGVSEDPDPDDLESTLVRELDTKFSTEILGRPCSPDSPATPTSSGDMDKSKRMASSCPRTNEGKTKLKWHTSIFWSQCVYAKVCATMCVPFQV